MTIHVASPHLPPEPAVVREALQAVYFPARGFQIGNALINVFSPPAAFAQLQCMALRGNTRAVRIGRGADKRQSESKRAFTT